MKRKCRMKRKREPPQNRKKKKKTDRKGETRKNEEAFPEKSVE